MPNPAGPRSSYILSRKNRALLAAALVALGTTQPQLRAQTDLTAVRARAEQGDPEALNALGNAYANGQGVPQSFAEALRCYQQAADRGLAAAQFNLGMMHELGRGTAPDQTAAFKLYLKAAEQGFAPAQFNVGNMYASGLGVRQDYFEAGLWFRQAADRGVPEAQYNLALAYELGRGVAKDEASAQRWYRAAAGQRYARAQYNLALMLEEGRGSAADPAAAMEFYRAAALQNFAPAQNNLGILLAEGRGTAANPVEAYTWLALAVENGAKPVGRDIVARQLSAPELADANARVAKLRAQLGLTDMAPAPASGGGATAAAGGAGTAKAPISAVTGAPPKEVVALNSRVVAAESELEQLRAENARLTEATRVLTREKAALEQRVTSAGNPSQGARPGEPDRREIEQLRAALNEAQAKVAAARESASGGAADQRLRDLAEQLEVVSAERDRLLQVQAASGPMREALADTSRQRDALVQEKAGVEQRLTRSNQEASAQRAAAEKLEAANAQLAARLEAVTSERDRLVSARAGSEGAEKLNAQLEAARRTIVELEAKSDSLQKDLEVSKQSAAAALAAQAAAVKAGPSDALRLELETLQNQVRGLETQLGEDRKNSAREIAALASQLQNARETSRALTEANRSLLQAKGSEDSATRSEIDQANARVKSVQAELAKARAENESIRAEAAQVRANFAALEERQAEAERAATQHGATVAELTGLNEKISREKATLEKKLAEAKDAAEAARGELAELRGRAGAGDRALQEQLVMMNELSAANEKLQLQLKELGAQLTTLRNENARLATAGEAMTTLRADLDDAKARLAEARKSADQHGSVVAELTGANEKLASELKELQAQVASLRAENARLAQGDAARQDAEQRAASLAAAANQLAAAQRDLAGARAEIARLNDTVQALDRDRSTRVAQLQQENGAISARLRQAQGTLDQIASAARLINGGAAAVPGMPANTATQVMGAPVPVPVAASSSPIVPAPRVHTVAEGDSLTRISVRYYGTGNRWQEIYDANRETLRGENALKPGQRLRIP